MSFLERFNQRFGFTRNESLVVLFLTGTLLVGGAIKLTKELAGAAEYDYSALDEEFARRSRQALAADSLPAENTDGRDSAIQRPKTQTPRGGKLRNPSHGRVNINTATKSELMSLPGVGEVTAEHIIMHRQDNGPFKSLDDLEGVKGIGKKKLERIAPFVVFDSTLTGGG